MTKKPISPTVIKILALMSQGKCAMCKTLLVGTNGNGEKYNVSEYAHIEGEKEGSKRYNPLMTDKQRQAQENLIVLCPNCHTKIDSDDITYTVEVLKKIKEANERIFSNNLIQSINNIDYSYLQITLEHIKNSNILPSTDINLEIRKIQDKINYNKLSSNIQKYITMGLANSDIIRNFINQQSTIIFGFSEKLKNIFTTKYAEFKNTTIDSDEIFLDLWGFAKANTEDMETTAAALSIITYFFQECDIFEK